MRKVFTLFAVLLFAAVMVGAQDVPPKDAPPQQPNEGTHIQFSANYDANGSNVAVLGVTIPITNRWSLVQINAVPTNNSNLSFHTLEVEYSRNLADLLKGKSAQVNPGRFIFAVSGGAGSVRNAQGSGNASFAFSVGGRLTLRVNDSTAIDILNVRRWQSRIATITGQSSGSTDLGMGFRFSF